MKYLIFLMTIIVPTSLCFAGEGLSRKEYSDMFALHGQDSTYWPSIAQCLIAWGNTPFKDADSKKFRVIESSVKVFGIGDNTNDEVKTNYPQLILVRPTVSVMSKTTYNLNNPNGWYCFKGQVNVMGKSIINLACKTHIADSKGSETVMGKNEEKSGTTVMGKTVVNRKCD